MSTMYRRVPSGDAGSSTATMTQSPSHQDGSEQAVAGSPTRTAAERISDKVQALAWIAAAIGVAKLTHLPRVLMSDERVLRPVLAAALLLLGINAILTLYLAIYLPRFKGLRDPSVWEVYCPRVIPAITALGVLCGVLLIRSLWPVWGFLTPLVLGVEFMGALMTLHFVPWL